MYPHCLFKVVSFVQFTRGYLSLNFARAWACLREVGETFMWAPEVAVLFIVAVFLIVAVFGTLLFRLLAWVI